MEENLSQSEWPGRPTQLLPTSCLSQAPAASPETLTWWAPWGLRVSPPWAVSKYLPSCGLSQMWTPTFLENKVHLEVLGRKSNQLKVPSPPRKDVGKQMWKEGREDREVYGLPKAGAALQRTGTDGTVPHRPAGPSRGLRGAAATAGSLRQGPARSRASCPALGLVGSWERGGHLASERAAGREGGSPLALPLAPPPVTSPRRCRTPNRPPPCKRQGCCCVPVRGRGSPCGWPAPRWRAGTRLRIRWP